jgi:adenylate cyclase
MSEGPDFAAEGLLDGLEGDERDARVALLEQLDEAGFSLDELREAAAQERLPLLPVERELRREEAYSAREVAEEAGIPLELLSRIQQAFGMPVIDPDEKSFTEDGMAAAKRVAEFRRFGLPEEGMIEVTRVIGQSMSRLAEAIRGLVFEAVRPATASEHDIGLRYAEAAKQLMPELAPMLYDALTAHLAEQIRGDVVLRAEEATGRALPGARDMGVAFADLVGFTRLGEGRPVNELGALADRLAHLAQASARPPVKLVKTVGDAAMLVSPEPGPLLDAVLALVQAAEAEGPDFPQLKAGVAFGPVLSRGGDWYGHTVNVASRITGIARPGSVLATEAAHDALADGYAWSFAGDRKLKNVREPVKLFRARPPRDEA